MPSAAYTWAKILQALEERLTAVTVCAWFDDAEVVALDDKALILYTPSDFRREVIYRSARAHIEEILREQLGLSVALEVWGDTELRRHRQEAARAPLWKYNPQFNFDSYVAGEGNQMPLKVSMHIARQLYDANYNPLFLYGPPGVGKTHLLYAIANLASALYPDKRIVYVKAEQFTNEMITAIQTGRRAEFKNLYREADLLLIDDIQFISGKEATQEEFFHTFNKLYEEQKQIVMTSDRKPSDMLTLEKRLMGRFSEGVMIKIEPPDDDARRKIIRVKAQQLGLTLDEGMVGYLSEKLCDDVRQIEGGLRKLRAFRELSGMRLTLDTVARTVEDIRTSETCAVITPELVVRYVCRYYGVEPSMLKSTQRSKNIAEPRQVAMYLMRDMTSAGFEEIGKHFCRDRTTALHAVRKVQSALSVRDGDMAGKLQDIKRNIEANV